MKQDSVHSLMKLVLPIAISYLVSVAANQSSPRFGPDPVPILILISVCSGVSFLVDRVDPKPAGVKTKSDPFQLFLVFCAIAMMVMLAVLALALYR